MVEIVAVSTIMVGVIGRAVGGVAGVQAVSNMHTNKMKENNLRVFIFSPIGK